MNPHHTTAAHQAGHTAAHHTGDTVDHLDHCAADHTGRQVGLHSLARVLVLVLLTGGLATGLTAGTSTGAAAAARVSVSNDQGTAAADTRYRTELRIEGNGFQSVKGGFGGVYLMFGWVSDPGGGSWKPSRGGITGQDYRYIPDSESADNAGYMKFIAFPGGSTAAEAHAVMSRSGSFSIKLTVPGSSFQSVDRNGNLRTVDCTKVTCGVITIGAHGVQNRSNETFTPVRFTDVYGDQPPAGQQSQNPSTNGNQTDPSNQPDPSGGGADDGSDQSDNANGKNQQRGKRKGGPAAVVDRATARAGNALAFTGTGFTPREQVLGILDDGLAAIGPMIAGEAGEVAGLLQLPPDLEPGTHELRLVGAASGTQTTERFPVQAPISTDPESASTSGEQGDDSDGLGGVDGSRLFLLAAAVVFLVAALVFGLGWLRRRRRRRRGPGRLPVAEGATS